MVRRTRFMHLGQPWRLLVEHGVVSVRRITQDGDALYVLGHMVLAPPRVALSPKGLLRKPWLPGCPEVPGLAEAATAALPGLVDVVSVRDPDHVPRVQSAPSKTAAAAKKREQRARARVLPKEAEVHTIPAGSRWTFVSAPSREIWTVRCICGAKKTVDAHAIRHGRSRSCGCLIRDVQTARARDLIGMRAGKLVVQKLAGSNPRRYHCLCDCGKRSIVASGEIIRGAESPRGGTRSCGCSRRGSRGEVRMSRAVMAWRQQQRSAA